MDKALKVEVSNKNHEKKKRSTEIKDFQKDSSKKTSEENQNTKKINWEEEEETLKKYLQREKYTLKKINKIIKGKKEKYINLDKYRFFFLKAQSVRLMANIKKSNKLSKAHENVKVYFDDEAKEDSHGTNKISDDNSEDDVEDEDDDDETEEEDSNNESKSLTNSDDEENDDENNNAETLNSTTSRKRKCEFSTLDDNLSKKRKFKFTTKMASQWEQGKYTIIFSVID